MVYLYWYYTWMHIADCILILHIKSTHTMLYKFVIKSYQRNLVGLFFPYLGYLISFLSFYAKIARSRLGILGILCHPYRVCIAVSSRWKSYDLCWLMVSEDCKRVEVALSWNSSSQLLLAVGKAMTLLYFQLLFFS